MVFELPMRRRTEKGAALGAEMIARAREDAAAEADAPVDGTAAR
jgi:hypothetical protein